MSFERVGDRIRATREERDWTQEDLAREMNRPDAQTQITKWETGVSKPSAPNLAVLAEALGVSIDYLVTGRKDDATKSASLLLAARKRVAELAILLGVAPTGAEGVPVNLTDAAKAMRFGDREEDESPPGDG